MASSSTPDPALQNVRDRARRLRRQFAPQRSFDHFGLGMLVALVIDVGAAAMLVAVHDFPGICIVLLGPLSLASSTEAWIATALALAAAGIARRWRLLWGMFAVQVALVLLACIWPLITGPVRLLPL